MCTGHSLGGALATLAAYDLQAEFAFRKLQVYTFGSPRTGNHAFAHDYERRVPHTWHVVNERACPSNMKKTCACEHVTDQPTVANCCPSCSVQRIP